MQDLRLIENELVPVYTTDKGVKVVNGRELHQSLQSGQDFSTWVKKRLTECDAEENKDFQRFHKKMEANNATMIEYIIKLNTAKEMAMLERNEKGKEIRKYFIKVEEKYKQDIVDRSQLSPQLQSLFGLIETQARQELEQKRQAEQLNRIEHRQQIITEALSNNSDDEDFQKWVSKSIARIAESSKFVNGGNRSQRYACVTNESYERLNKKRPCRLEQRVREAKGRALENDPTIKKYDLNKINKLYVISHDKDLKTAYELVLKEMVVYYCSDVA